MSAPYHVPADLLYTTEHEWAQRTGENVVRVGITDFAQSALGDVVFVQLPAVGDQLSVGASFGEVESTKSVSDLYAPITGTVIAVNEDLDATPQLVNSDPYAQGWLVDVEFSDADRGQLDQLLTADAYLEFLQQQS